MHELPSQYYPPEKVAGLLDLFWENRGSKPDAMEAYEKLTKNRTSEKTSITWAKAKGYPLTPENIFVKTLGSGRTRPMVVPEEERPGLDLEIYYHQSQQSYADEESWQSLVYASIHELVYLNSLYDSGAITIPIVIIRADMDSAKQAMAYFELMGRTVDDESLLPELESEFPRMEHLFRDRGLYQPCFYKLQACFRTLVFQFMPSLALPSFVVLQVLPPTADSPMFSTLSFPIFASKSHMPPPSLLKDWPKDCPCPDDCPDFLQLPRTEEEAHWFRVGKEPEIRRVCNVDGCNKLDRGKKALGMPCTRCNRVYYCSSAHQKGDWKDSHKRACVR